VRVRVPLELVETLAARWKMSTADAVIRAVKEATMNMFAAVGDDGTRPVVWGLGATEAEALADAHEQEFEVNEDLACYPISEEQAAVVRSGDVSWPIAVGR
jgi:hypothetical protein